MLSRFYMRPTLREAGLIELEHLVHFSRGHTMLRHEGTVIIEDGQGVLIGGFTPTSAPPGVERDTADDLFLFLVARIAESQPEQTRG